MAKVRSLIKFEGTLDDLTFYKGEDGYLVKTKSAISKNRIHNDPAFIRTRENNAEFANAATSGKFLRRAITALMYDAKDQRVTSRLTQVMSRVNKEDQTSPRGERTVADGIQTPQGKAWLKNFNFNKHAVLESVLLTNFQLNTTSGEIVITNLVPRQQLGVPEGATHVSFSSAFLNLDMATDDKDLELSNEVNLPIDLTPTTVTLSPATPTGTGEAYFFLKIAFFQEINGVQYALNNGAFNALQLLEVV
ncbi:hypothetical protein DMZ43_11165 [Meridianimaribacter sp. CL38]|uniref:hypothetical protein n=1 Tax=Meridianimaribacter sp. CL38 TaxID=2213021 RepID=UPI00103D4908|nr:hypothetical protein [Meridianimaribacter sp. CL38]TBV25498.1 hypothetical protein DMZ43_11165 [Meridianimaribacter sp. CL38]